MSDTVWYSNPYLPWNWPSDLSQSFVSELESGLEYVLHLIILSFLGILTSLLSLVEDAFGGAIISIVDAVTSLGPLGLPLFVAFFIISIGVAMDLFHFAHDLPIIGDAI